MENSPREGPAPERPRLESLDSLYLYVQGEEDLSVRPRPSSIPWQPVPPEDGPVSEIYLEIEGEEDLTEGPVPEAIRKKWREKGNGPPIPPE